MKDKIKLMNSIYKELLSKGPELLKWYHTKICPLDNLAAYKAEYIDLPGTMVFNAYEFPLNPEIEAYDTIWLGIDLIWNMEERRAWELRVLKAHELGTVSEIKGTRSTKYVEKKIKEITELEV